MYSHAVVGITDFERALAFYKPLMQALDLKPRFEDRAKPWAGWHGDAGARPMFVIARPQDGQAHAAGNGQMVAFAAATRAVVDQVHRTALQHGGVCAGAPGLRPAYHADYYGAYFRDPDGNKLAVACHAPAFGDTGVLEAEHVLLRLVTATDLPDLLLVNGEAEVTQFLPYASWQSLADAQAWFERVTQMQATGTGLQYVVVDKALGCVIGSCLLFRHEAGSARAELGYVLGRAHWGQGRMREAVVRLVEHAFSRMGLRRLEAEVNPANVRSAQLLVSLGFVHEGLRRQRWASKGPAYDVAAYGLLSHEWQPPGV